MAKLSPAQIKGYAQDAGFSAGESTTMTAIALAESGGETTSHNAVPPDDSYGLWQINMIGKLGPSRLKEFGLTSASQLFDPAANAVAARKIYLGSGYHAWSTYTSGAYKLYMHKAGATAINSSATQGSALGNTADIIAGVAGGPLGMAAGAYDAFGSSAGDVVSSGVNIANDIGKLGAWISNPTNWLRILYVTGGAAAILFAAQALFKPVTDAAIKGAVKTASNAIPEAKAVTKTASVAKTASSVSSTPAKTTSVPSKSASKTVSASSASDAKARRLAGHTGPIRHDY
jgi:hypothetical protein